jgi:hypothetical protein
MENCPISVRIAAWATVALTEVTWYRQCHLSLPNAAQSNATTAASIADFTLGPLERNRLDYFGCIIII